MAAAMIGGAVSSGVCAPADVFVSNPGTEKLTRLSEAYGVHTTTDNLEVVRSADILFLCVKPQMMDTVLSEIAPALRAEQTIVSIAAGKSIAYFEEKLGPGRKLVRVMPNTPALCGEGMSAVCGSEEMQKPEHAAEFEDVLSVCRSFGEAMIIPEPLVDVAGQVAGASPAWIFMVIEALADGAVACGMPRAMAYRFASQGVAGAGKLAVKTEKHPGELKDMVTSPGGTTIEGVRALEENGVRAAFMDAVIRAFEKSRRM